MADTPSTGERLAAEAASGALDVDSAPQTPSIPSVSTAEPALLRRVIQAMKQTMDVREGRAGSILDKHLTLRDLVRDGAITLRVGSDSFQRAGGPVVAGTGYADTRPVLTVPPPPTALTVQGAFKTIQLSWTLLDYANHAYVEVWRSATDAVGTATLNGTSTANLYVDNSGAVGVVYYYWVRAVSQQNQPGPFNATSGVTGGLLLVGTTNLGPLVVEAGNLKDGAVSAAKIATTAIDATKFASSIEPIGLVTSVPGSKGSNPSTIFNSGDGKLYRWSGSAYISTIPATDLSSQILAGQIANGQISSTHLTSELLDLIGEPPVPDTTAPGVVTSVSAVGGIRTVTLYWTAPADTDLAGYQVWRSTSNDRATATQVASIFSTVYSDPTAAGTTYYYWIKAFDRSGNVGAFNAGTGATGIAGTTGSVASADILADAVTAVKLAAGAVTAAKTSIAAIDSASGNLTANSVTATQIVAGEITAVKLAADSVTAAKIQAGAITTDKMTVDTINANVIATGTIQAAQLGADSVTAAKIKAGEVTAGKLGVDAVVAGNIKAGEVQAGKLAANAVVAGNIAADAVTTTTMTANSINGDRIAGGTLEAGKIVAGSITASQIASGAITTAKLLVTGQGAALNADPMAQDLSAWNFVSGRSVLTTVTDGPAGETVLRLTSLVSNDYGLARSIKFPVAAGKQYRLRLWARRNGGTGTSYFRVVYYNAFASLVYFGAVDDNTSAGQFEGITVPTSWTPYSGRTTAPVGAVYAILELYGNYQVSAGAATGTTDLQNIRCEEMVGYDMVVDGSIIAGKIATGTIVAGDGVIQNGAITNALIGNLAVDNAKIADATIQGAKIADATIGSANIIDATITGAKIADATIGSANIIDATITGAKIADATITNANIADATISAAKIGVLTAGNLTVTAISNTINGGAGGDRVEIASNVIRVWSGGVIRVKLGNLA